jgi:drug/metabolite transporter (DMT)-like permease
MISTSIWGFFFWNSPVTLPVISGLVLVVVALVLCLYNGKSADSEKKISTKWLLFISLYFIGNSLGSITQRTQQINYESAYGDFLMVVATAVSLIVCLVFYLRSDRSDTKKILRSSGYIPAICGALNFVINLVIIILATQLSASVVYPVMMIGALAITGIFSIFIFKEKMRWWQWLGVAVGALAIILLSI